MVCENPRSGLVAVWLSMALCALTACQREKPPAAPTPAAPPAPPSPAPLGTFVSSWEVYTQKGGKPTTAYTIVRVAKSGQLCTMDMSGFDLDGFATAFSKACDHSAKFQAQYESAKYTSADGKIAYAMGDVDYTGSLRGGKLVLEFVNRATHNQGNTEYERFLLDDEPADGAPFATPGLWRGEGKGFSITFTVSPNGSKITGGRAAAGAGGRAVVHFMNQPIRIIGNEFRFRRSGNSGGGLSPFSVEGKFDSQNSVSGLVNGRIAWSGKPEAP